MTLLEKPDAPHPRPITVMTVDDHPLLREGIASALASDSGFRLVGEAATGRMAIDEHRKHRPDVTLMDMLMPDISGIEAMKSIRLEAPDARIVVLTTYEGDAPAVAALKAGASGYLLKSMLSKELLSTIRSVHAGTRCIPERIALDIARYAGCEELSEREMAVLQRLAAGRANKQVARDLGIKEETVKSHVSRIIAKLCARDRTDALMIAIRRGLLRA